MTIEDLVVGVESCELPVEAFGHRAHVRLAWHYLRTAPLLQAMVRFAETLQTYAAHHGAAGKYDELVTASYVLLIEHRRREEPSAGWSAFERANADLFEDGKALLRRLFSEHGIR